MADNAHGFDVKEIPVAKIGFHKKNMEVMWNLSNKSASIVEYDRVYRLGVMWRTFQCLKH